MEGLRFRLYSPASEKLQPFADPIDVEPVDVRDLVQAVIEEATRTAPHLPDSKLALVPRKMDSDLKRIMKPQIDELLGETKDALIRMRGAKHTGESVPD
jgi:hypothetical protein